MVLYDFICANPECSHVFELRRHMSDISFVACPICGSEARKLISAPSIVMNWRDSDSVHGSQRFRGAVQHRALRSAGGS